MSQDYLFIDQAGATLDTLECASVDEAYKAAIRFAAQHQTKVTVTIHSFEIEKPVCDCGEAMELDQGCIICPTCEANPTFSVLDWRSRPAVTDLMTRHNISRNTAAEMYRMKD